MAIFIITPLRNDTDLLNQAISEHFPSDADRYRLQNNKGWLLQYNGTGVELSELLGITRPKMHGIKYRPDPNKPATGPALVIPISSYYGSGPSEMWDWLQTVVNAMSQQKPPPAVTTQTLPISPSVSQTSVVGQTPAPQPPLTSQPLTPQQGQPAMQQPSQGTPAPQPGGAHPYAVPPAAVYMQPVAPPADPSHNFNLEVVMDMSKTVGEMRGTIESFKNSTERSLARQESAIAMLHNAVHSNSRILFIGTTLLIIYLIIGGFILNKAWNNIPGNYSITASFESTGGAQQKVAPVAPSNTSTQGVNRSTLTNSATGIPQPLLPGGR